MSLARIEQGDYGIHARAKASIRFSRISLRLRTDTCDPCRLGTGPEPYGGLKCRSAAGRNRVLIPRDAGRPDVRPELGCTLLLSTLSSPPRLGVQRLEQVTICAALESLVVESMNSILDTMLSDQRFKDSLGIGASHFACFLAPAIGLLLNNGEHDDRLSIALAMRHCCLHGVHLHHYASTYAQKKPAAGAIRERL